MEKIKRYIVLGKSSVIEGSVGSIIMYSDYEAQLRELLLRLQREAISMQENAALIEMEKVEQIFAELGITQEGSGL